jgi:Tfp pilus assembly protein FimT
VLFRRQKQAGVTLMELILLMVLVAPVMGLSAAAVVTALRAANASRDDLTRDLARGRLAAQFREDARAADSVMIALEPAVADASASPPPAAVFTLPDGRRIEYARAENGLARRELAGERVVHFEEYALAAGTRAIFEPLETEPRMVRMTLSLPYGPNAARQELAAWRLVVEARLAADRRFAPRRENEP